MYEKELDQLQDLSAGSTNGSVERFIAVPVSPSYLTDHLRSLQAVNSVVGGGMNRCQDPDDMSLMSLPAPISHSLVASAQVIVQTNKSVST